MVDEGVPTKPQPICSYCGEKHGTIQLIAVGWPGRLDVHNAWLHPDCERGYLRMIGEPTS